MSPDHSTLRTWQRIRRHAVPAAMIAACAERRAAGDWRGACAAGNVEVDLDLDRVAADHGDDAAARIAADLAGLAPDLLRWHLPRALGGWLGLATGTELVLSSADGPLRATAPALVVRLPNTVGGSQRLRLRVAPVGAGGWLDLAPHLWHAGHANGLRAALGGSADRMPGFRPDGSPLPADEFATGPDPDDPAANTEWLYRCVAADDADAAWQAVGTRLDLDGGPTGRGYRVAPRGSLHYLRNAAGLTAELRRLTTRYGRPAVTLRPGGSPGPALTVDAGEPGAPRVYAARHDDPRPARPAHLGTPDLDLLWHGMIGHADLHPLVLAPLFPHRAATVSTAGAPVPVNELLTPVRVRCRGEWHVLAHGGGELRATAHDPGEAYREATLVSLGGAMSGCFAARRAWTTGTEQLPRALRVTRRDIIARLAHEGAPFLVELFDAGLDPRMRDGHGRTFLHHLRLVDHAELLPRLLAAGLDVDVRDRTGRTPLHLAVEDGASVELVADLLAAGADPDVPDNERQSPRQRAAHLRSLPRGALATAIHECLTEWRAR